ncbi:MAG: DUF4296 domain-containing protein [Bacteroidaceae bacterium]
MKKVVYFLCVLIVVSCKVDKPRDVLDEDEMEQILYDFHLARAMGIESDSSDVMTRAYVLACFKKHGISEQQFDHSMLWYCQHMDELQKIYQRIDERYNLQLSSLGAATNDVNRYSLLSATGDTANIWHDRHFYLLSGNGFTNRVYFEVEADTSFKAGDKFLFNFRAEFLQREGQRHGVASLAVEYENDSVVHTERHFYGNGDYTLPLPSIEMRAKRVYGFIYMISEWNESPRLLFVYRPSLVRMRDAEALKAKEAAKMQQGDSIKSDTAHIVSAKTPDTTKTMSSPNSLSPGMMHSRPKPRKITH